MCPRLIDLPRPINTKIVAIDQLHLIKFTTFMYLKIVGERLSNLFIIMIKFGRWSVRSQTRFPLITKCSTVIHMISDSSELYHFRLQKERS